MRDSFHSEGVTDLKAIQASAQGRLENPHYPGYPDETRIHHHPKGEPCNGNVHESYMFPQESQTLPETTEGQVMREAKGTTLEFAEDRFDAGSG